MEVLFELLSFSPVPVVMQPGMRNFGESFSLILHSGGIIGQRR
jgi:hypothetical protein